MKTASDPRHQKRVKIIKEIFAWGFLKPSSHQNFNQITKKIFKHLKKIDQIIKKAAPQFPLRQINKIDLAILRLAIWELVIEKNAPYKVIIDEAVELAKEYGGEKSPQFINGVLGTAVKEYGR